MFKVLVWLSLLATAQSQLLQPGTIDVPIPRPGDCGSVGPATYVYRMSSKPPNDFFPDVCKGMGGAEVHFNDPCAWAHGQAQITVARFTKMCKGATRTIHWHAAADEWGYVHKGRLETYIASPDGLPWTSSSNVLSEHGVWYFPSGWLHGLLCHTPEEEGGCEFMIVFASPQAAEPNGHNLDTTFAQAPASVAAAALGVSTETYAKYIPSFARARVDTHYTITNMTSPIVTAVAPGACDPECPKVVETIGAPAAVEADAVEKTIRLPNAPGVLLHQIRTTSFIFARTMSQERTELEPGALRPMVWTSADAVLFVVSGKILMSLEGGLPGAESHLFFGNETLEKGDIAYIPNGRAFWFQEATGKTPATTITVFNVGEWKQFEMSVSMASMPQIAVMSNLHLLPSKVGMLRASQIGLAQKQETSVFGLNISASMVFMFAVSMGVVASGLAWLTRRSRHKAWPQSLNPLLA